MSKPWLTDLKYGGMSERSAQLSHESWVRQGCRVLPLVPPAESDEEIAVRKASIDVQMADFRQAIIAAAAWFKGWKSKQRARGFRCVEVFGHDAE